MRMLNINYGRNKELLDVCKPLSEYAWFVQEIRRNRKSNEIEKAVDMAIDAMPGDYSIREFLLLHRAEVYGLLDTEYNEEEIRELFMEDGRREGREEERKNTEAERKKAEAERQRADAAEARVKELEALLAAKKL